MTSLAHGKHRPTANPGTPIRVTSPVSARLTTVRTAGELLITAGAIVLLYLVYQLFWTGVETARAQGDLREELTQLWESPPLRAGTRATDPQQQTPPAPVNRGEGMAIIRIPRFGMSYAWVIVEGVGESDLRLGPGHYPESAGPGEVGNFAVAGHRTTYGAPFANLDALVPGDAIVIETADTYYTYRVDNSKVVLPSQVDVVLPVPNAPGRTPTEALMTLTTCHPRYAATERLVVLSRFESQEPRLAGPPSALGG